MSNDNKMTKKQNILQIIKFALFSASAGIIQLVSFTLLFEVAGLNNTVSYIISLALSVLWNFTFNRKFTFKSAANIPVAMFKVALFYCVFAPLSTWWTHELTALGINEYLIEAGTMAVNLVTEYLYCRFIVYRNSMNTRD
ncbi:MAG: GtrA family protein [Ruminococcaceae bacterium]|nr:GtrA family protein [Oscillospiraceae bacterium]